MDAAVTLTTWPTPPSPEPVAVTMYMGGAPTVRRWTSAPLDREVEVRAVGLSPVTFRLFGALCAEISQRGRPLTWAQLADVRRVAVAFDPDAPPRARQAMGPVLTRLSFTWSTVRDLAAAAGLDPARVDQEVPS